MQHRFTRRFTSLFPLRFRSCAIHVTVATLLSTLAQPASGHAVMPARSTPGAGAGAHRAAPVLPHLKLVRSYPAADTVLTGSPDAVRLWLSESAEMPTTKITLTTAAGAAVRLSRLTRAGAKDAPLVAALAAPLKDGSYNVAWRTMSRDGHVVKGSFTFRVRGAVSRAR